MAKIDISPKKTYTLGLYLEKMKTNFERYMHLDVHSSTETWKQPNSPSTSD